MRRLLTITLLLTLTALAAPPVKKKATAKKAPAHTTAKGKTSAHKSVARKGTAGKRTVAVRAPQMQATPSSDRYKEIQDALVAKGYLKTPASGVWDQDSQEAMRKFQSDQNLDPTGKLSSRSLISLGLGPKP